MTDKKVLVSGEYMLRRKFRIPNKEIERFYGRKDITVNDFLFPCDYEDDDSCDWGFE